MSAYGNTSQFNKSVEDNFMILDTMTYSIMTVVALLSFITVILAQFPEGSRNNRDK